MPNKDYGYVILYNVKLYETRSRKFSLFPIEHSKIKRSDKKHAYTANFFFTPLPVSELRFRA